MVILMVFKCKKGYYELIKNFKDAFNLANFEEAYIEECFDKYPYVVGDLSDSLLRLKGFNTDSKSPNFFKNIDKYITESCAFEAPYFILKRIHNDEEYNKLEAKNTPTDLGPEINHLVIQKENFDKDSLVLESHPGKKPNIILDMNRINAIPKGTLPSDIRDDNDTEEKTTTTVSSSDGFIPPKRNNNGNNNRNNNRNKNNNTNKRNRNNQNRRKSE